MTVPTSRILGIGTDILQLSRIRKVITRTPWALNRFARRILSQDEMTDWQQQQKTHSANTVLEFNLRYLATRWAAKEATYKACYPHQILTWNDVTIYKKHGQPKIRIHNMDSKTNMLDGHLSLSHDGDYVVAFVILTMHSIEGEGQQQQQQQQQQ